jgi:hypothetical protein
VAPVSPSARTSRASRLSPWGRLVAVSAAVVAGAVIGLGIWAVADQHERRVTYTVRGMLNGVALDVGDADVLVVGAGPGEAVGVEHVDRYAFGHDARTRRSVEGGVFRVRSRCPRTALQRCSVRYRVTVPDNLPLTVRTATGHVTLRGYRGSALVVTGDGDVDVTGFCGFSLQARAEGGGDVRAATACAPQRLTLRSTTGAVRAQVPTGRYRVEASTAHGAPAVRGIASDPDAPFAIQALSSSGPVVVERTP